jgi:hypothetical protein
MTEIIYYVPRADFGTDLVRRSVGVPEECVTCCTTAPRGNSSEETGDGDGGCHDDRTGLVRATCRYDWPPMTVSDGITRDYRGGRVEGPKTRPQLVQEK